MSTHDRVVHLGTFKSWLVVLGSALFFFYIFIQMNLFSSISSELVKEFNFSPQQIGHFIASYSLGNVIFLFPAGMMLDRFSVRKLLLTVFAISIIATYIFSNSDNFWVMNTLRFIIGLCGAFTFISAVKLASRWFEPRHMALVVGLVVTMGMFGGVAAQTPLTILTEKVGWRDSVQLIAALGLVLLIIQLLIVRDEPRGLAKVEVQEHVKLEKIGFWHSLGRIIMNRQNWLSGLYISLVNLPVFVIGQFGGKLFLTQVHHFESVEASNIVTMIFVGMIVGSPLSGWISDWLGLRKLPMVIGAVLSVAAMLVVMFAPTMPYFAEMALYFVLGVVVSSQVIGYPVIAESNDHSITATATSLGSVLIMSGGMLVPVFGWLLERSGTAQVIDGVAVYSAADFVQANYLMLIGLIVALFVSLLVKETYCKPLHKIQ